MAEIPDMKEIAQKIAKEAVEQIRINVDGEDMTLNEFGAMVRRYYAIPVVRCVLCRHWENACWCNNLERGTDRDWYCADGETKRDGDSDADR